MSFLYSSPLPENRTFLKVSPPSPPPLLLLEWGQHCFSGERDYTSKPLSASSFPIGLLTTLTLVALGSFVLSCHFSIKLLLGIRYDIRLNSNYSVELLTTEISSVHNTCIYWWSCLLITFCLFLSWMSSIGINCRPSQWTWDGQKKTLLSYNIC